METLFLEMAFELLVRTEEVSASKYCSSVF